MSHRAIIHLNDLHPEPGVVREKFKRSEEYGYVGELRPQFHVASDAVVMGQA